jgi:hypothetical protein
MSHNVLTSLDLDDLTPRQLRKILNGVARSQLPYARKTKEEQEEDKEEGNKKNDDLVDLHEEKHGDSKPPKVLASDLPHESVAKEKEDDEDEDGEKKPATKKGKV